MSGRRITGIRPFGIGKKWKYKHKWRMFCLLFSFRQNLVIFWKKKFNILFILWSLLKISFLFLFFKYPGKNFVLENQLRFFYSFNYRNHLLFCYTKSLFCFHYYCCKNHLYYHLLKCIFNKRRITESFICIDISKARLKEIDAVRTFQQECSRLSSH